MEYSPDPVGRVAIESNMWMNDDLNHNGKCDGPYDSWVDKNNDGFRTSTNLPWEISYCSSGWAAILSGCIIRQIYEWIS